MTLGEMFVVIQSMVVKGHDIWRKVCCDTIDGSQGT